MRKDRKQYKHRFESRNLIPHENGQWMEEITQRAVKNRN